MFGPLSIFEKDVFKRDRFHPLTSDDGQEAGPLAMIETIRVLLFLIPNRIKMDNQIEG